MIEFKDFDMNRFYTTKEAAEKLNVTSITITNYLKNGKLDGEYDIKHKRYLIYKESADNYYDSVIKPYLKDFEDASKSSIN